MNHIQRIRTMCPMSCHPTLCGMLVEIEDGKLLRITGDKDNPDSQGFLCVRGQASREVIDNPQRLLHPLMRDRRTEDAWREASWEEVLERIGTRMQAVGREAVGLWSGHGASANNYGTRIGGQLLRRFANLYGSQWWSGAIICWGLGAFGLGLTGVLETNTKEDMGQHADLIVLWGANLASQPNTSRHLIAAKRRGAYVITVDVRDTEAAAQSDEVLQLRPGTDTALALALMHVIIAAGLYDRAFVAQHTVGFEALQTHVQPYTPEWAAGITGIPAERIVALARRYATTRPAMIVLGGSSMHKGANSWHAGRAIACLPALTGNLGIPGGGFGPRHGSSTHGQGLADIAANERRPPGDYIPSQMASMTEAFLAGRIQVLLLFGTNLMSSFADTNAMAAGLARVGLVVSHDLFMNDTARRFADIVLPEHSLAGGTRLQDDEHASVPHGTGPRGPRRNPFADMDYPGSGRPPWPDRLFPLANGRSHDRCAARSSGDRARHRGSATRPGWDWGAAHLACGASGSALLDPFRKSGVLCAACGGTRHAAFTSVYGLARHGAGPGAGPGAHADALP